MNEQTSKHKPIGICPHCNHEVRAKISVKNNYLRRDKCECPNCEETIYVCRNYGCRNYAIGGDNYDDELCPTCAKALMELVGKSSEILLTTLTVAFASFIVSKMENIMKK